MKYKTLKELVEAFKDPDSNLDHLVIDNDSTKVYVEEGPYNFVTVFDGGTPEDLLKEALDLLGIPWEPA